MKTVLFASGLAMALMQPAFAQNRDSDGDVLSVIPRHVILRDSDGNVISNYDSKVYVRDSDGEVISVIYVNSWDYANEPGEVAVLKADDGVTYQVDMVESADGTPTLPDQVSIDGLIYQVVMTEDKLTLQTASRVNPVAFSLD